MSVKNVTFFFFFWYQRRVYFESQRTVATKKAAKSHFCLKCETFFKMLGQNTTKVIKNFWRLKKLRLELTRGRRFNNRYGRPPTTSANWTTYHQGQPDRLPPGPTGPPTTRANRTAYHQGQLDHQDLSNVYLAALSDSMLRSITGTIKSGGTTKNWFNTSCMTFFW